MEMDEQVVFITGGAQGIGLAIARSFVRAGARIAIADADQDALEAARVSLKDWAARGQVAIFELDVRNRDAFETVAEQAEAYLGNVSVLCNNAGVRLPDSLTQLNYELWDAVIGINLEGVYNGIQTFLHRMLDRGTVGHIVNTASAAGLANHPNSHLVGSSGLTYRTSKSAVIALSEALRFDLEAAGHPIGVSVLCPGLVSTNISSNSVLRIGASPEQHQRAQRGDTVLHQEGIDARAVGEMVIEAIRWNQLYIHTDDVMILAIRNRTHELLAAMPPSPEELTSRFDRSEP